MADLNHVAIRIAYIAADLGTSIDRRGTPEKAIVERSTTGWTRWTGWKPGGPTRTSGNASDPNKRVHHLAKVLVAGSNPVSSLFDLVESTVSIKGGADPCALKAADKRHRSNLIYPSRSTRCSPTRMAFAMAVRAGFTAPMLGKKLVSTT